MATLSCDARMDHRKSEHLPQLDGLRAVAVALVLVAHEVGLSMHDVGWWSRTISLGGLGVLVFFVLSGFLITRLLLTEGESRGSVSLKAFYVRRVLRIMPAFYFYVAVVAILKSFKIVDDVSWEDVLIASCYLRNVMGGGATFHHTWSLALEEQFYFIWPLTLAALGRARAAGFALLVVVAILVWRTYSVAWLHVLVYFRPDYRFDSILVGCLLAFALPSLRARVSPWLMRVTSPFVVLPVAIGWTLYDEVVHTWEGAIGLPVQTTLVVALVMNVVMMERGWAREALSHPAMRFVGRLSYSLYLWQQLFIVDKYPSWGWARAPGVDLVMTCAAAMVSFYAIERPFLRLKRAFER